MPIKRVRLASAKDRRFEKLKIKCPDLEFLSPYINSRVPISVRYRSNPQCQHVWETSPTRLMQGSRCPFCCYIRGFQSQVLSFVRSLGHTYRDTLNITRLGSLAINTDTKDKEQGYLLALTEQYKARGVNLIHVFESEWESDQDLIKSIVKDFVTQGCPTLQDGRNIYPYHLHPNLTRMSPPALQSYGWDCGKAYNDVYQQECLARIESHLKELGVDYAPENNTFKTNKLHIKFIPVIEYQNYGTSDLMRFVNHTPIRTMVVFETQMLHEPHQWEVIKSNIAQALGLTKNRVFARKLECVKLDPKELKDFFNTNQQYGWIPAQTAFALKDPQTKEVYMSYMLSSGYYKRADVAIVRGACKLGCSIVGGTSKLWKHIVDYYKAQGKHSIVYYIDMNIHNGNSLEAIDAQLIATNRGLWNYWFDTERLKNREPRRHKEIKLLESRGGLMPVYNAGTRTYLYTF